MNLPRLRSLILSCMLLLQAPLFAFDRAGWVAVMPPGTHGTQGIATIIDERTVRLEHVGYDATGGRVFFYVGPDADYASFIANGFAISDEFTKTVYFDATLELTLPEGKTLEGANAISILCTVCQRTYCVGSFAAPRPLATAVIGSGSDSDGDGFSDAFEAGAGTLANNPLSTPLNGLPASTPEELRLKKLQIALKFTNVTEDSLQIALELPVPGLTRGLKLVVQIGDAVYPLLLDDESCACGKDTKLKFSRPGKDGWRTVSLKVTKTALQAALESAGLVNQDLKTTLNVPVTVLFNGAVYQQSIEMKYSARRDRRGLAKN